jgi:hypothetical protein
VKNNCSRHEPEADDATSKDARCGERAPRAEYSPIRRAPGLLLPIYRACRWPARDIFADSHLPGAESANWAGAATRHAGAEQIVACARWLPTAARRSSR